jgi:hypothetical protein
VGARVEVTGSAGTLVRERTAGEGYLGSFDPRLLFGLPDGEPVDVEVRWPGGAVSRLETVAVDRELVMEAP